MQQRLVVISADAMVGEDLRLLRRLPNFRKYLLGGAQVSQVRSIYPSITYPCHVTMSTGCYPQRHGIYSNYVFVPNVRSKAWHWWADAIRVPDLFTMAKAQGLRTAAVHWPVTANHPAIDDLIPDYWSQTPTQPLLTTMQQGGAPQHVLSILARHLPLHLPRVHPQCDAYQITCGCDILREYKPHVMFFHPSHLDAYRHSHGLFGDAITQGIYELDAFLGQIGQALEAAGTLESTNLVLTSDHGHLEIRHVINPNMLLAQAGLLQLDATGKIVDWQAILYSNGISAMVRLRNPADTALHHRVYTLLQQWCTAGIYGIAQVFTRAQVQVTYGLDGDFSFVLEADDCSTFDEFTLPPYVRPFSDAAYHTGHSTHGHLPTRGPQPIFVGKGPGFRSGAVLPQAALVDLAPTFAHLLHIPFPACDGRVLTELLQ